MSLLSLQRHPIHTIALGHLDTNMALLSLMIVPICMTITKEFKFQCGSIITFMGALTCKRHIPLDSNVVLLLLFASALSLFSINFRFQCGSIITLDPSGKLMSAFALDSNVVLLLLFCRYRLPHAFLL